MDRRHFLQLAAMAGLGAVASPGELFAQYRFLAPVKVAVLPLSRNEQLSPKAKELAARLRKRWVVEFDDAQAIGRRYRRQDEIGTPFCVTVDFDTLTDDAVTIRDRDTMAQERIPLANVESYLSDRLPLC